MFSGVFIVLSLSANHLAVKMRQSLVSGSTITCARNAHQRPEQKFEQTDCGAWSVIVK